MSNKLTFFARGAEEVLFDLGTKQALKKMPKASRSHSSLKARLIWQIGRSIKVDQKYLLESMLMKHGLAPYC